MQQRKERCDTLRKKTSGILFRFPSSHSHHSEPHRSRDARGSRQTPRTQLVSCQTIPEASGAVSVQRAFADTDGNS